MPEPYNNPAVIITFVVMGIVIFYVVLAVLKEGAIPLFEKVPKVLFVLCFTALALVGMDRTVIQFVTGQYTAVAVAILVTIAIAVFVVFKQMTRKIGKRGGDK